MRRFSISASVGLFLLFVGLPANAASVFIEFTGTVISDTGVGSPQSNQFFGTNAVGTSLFITELFTSPDSIFEQGSSRPNGTTSQATIISSNNVAVSSLLIGEVSGFQFTSNGFSSGITGGSTLAQGVIMLGLSKTGPSYDGSLSLLSAEEFSNREVVLDVSPQSVVLIATPLPPAFPMFASALLILGIVGYVRRKKDVAVAQT
jgi:hypothetical protein